eukprot:361612-Chlamydomonas_euryale.AAC.11
MQSCAFEESDLPLDAGGVGVVDVVVRRVATKRNEALCLEQREAGGDGVVAHLQAPGVEG